MIRVRSVFLVLAATSTLACQGKAAKPAEETKAQARAEPAPEAEPAKQEAPAKAAAEKPGPGAAVRDPSWFHPNAWPGATVEKTGRSAADPQGLYSSQILFVLPEGTTTQQCADTFTEKLKSEVANLAPDPKGAAGGRITLRGETEHYRATVVCGEVEGKQKAYLSYSWTKLPTG